MKHSLLCKRQEALKSFLFLAGLLFSTLIFILPKVGLLELPSVGYAQNGEEPGGRECLDQCEDGYEKYEQATCTGGCSGSPPKDDCECRSFKSYTCTATCVWGYCANTCCTNYEALCQYWWDCEEPPTSRPPATCDCWSLGADHPNLAQVKKGEVLNFTAEVSASETAAAPQVVLTLEKEGVPILTSGNLPTYFHRQETTNGTSVQIFQAIWPWQVPTSDDAPALYRLHLTINCGETGRGQERAQFLPSTPAPKTSSGPARLLERLLLFLGLRRKKTVRPQAFPTPTPTPPFQPPFPTVFRPKGPTLKLGTFLPELPASTCYDLYFRVVE